MVDKDYKPQTLSRKNSKNPIYTVYSKKGFSFDDLYELWKCRELLYVFIWRDIKVRYKQTLVGLAWVILQPLVAMIVVTIIFSKLIRLDSSDVPFPIFVFSGFVIWQYFSRSLTTASLSLVSNKQLVSKIYFPRLLLPIAVILAGLIDLAIAMVVLIVLLFIYDAAVTINMIALPAVILFAIISILAFASLLSALHVKYRDIGQALPFMTQIWLFITPVIYPISLIPNDWMYFYALNPMVGVVEIFRWTVLGHTHIHDPLIFLISVSVALLLLVFGLYMFGRMQSTFADTI